MGRPLFSSVYAAPVVHVEPEPVPAAIPYEKWTQLNRFDPDSDEFFERDDAVYEAFLDPADVQRAAELARDVPQRMDVLIVRELEQRSDSPSSSSETTVSGRGSPMAVGSDDPATMLADAYASTGLVAPSMYHDVATTALNAALHINSNESREGDGMSLMEFARLHTNNISETESPSVEWRTAEGLLSVQESAAGRRRPIRSQRSYSPLRVTSRSAAHRPDRRISTDSMPDLASVSGSDDEDHPYAHGLYNGPEVVPIPVSADDQVERRRMAQRRAVQERERDRQLASEVLVGPEPHTTRLSSGRIIHHSPPYSGFLPELRTSRRGLAVTPVQAISSGSPPSYRNRLAGPPAVVRVHSRSRSPVRSPSPVEQVLASPPPTTTPRLYNWSSRSPFGQQSTSPTPPRTWQQRDVLPMRAYTSPIMTNSSARVSRAQVIHRDGTTFHWSTARPLRVGDTI